MQSKTKLKIWMEENGFSNSQLAHELGLGYDYIYKISVRGDRNITETFKWRFTERFGRNEAAKVFELHTQPQTELVK